MFRRQPQLLRGWRQAHRLLHWLLALGGLVTIVVAAVVGDYRNEAWVLISLAAFTLALAGVTQILKASLGDQEAASVRDAAHDLSMSRDQ